MSGGLKLTENLSVAFVTSKNEFPVFVTVAKVVRFAPNGFLLVKLEPNATVRICYLDCHDKPRGCVNALLRLEDK